MAVFASVD
ncbi:hypothetical protein D021_1538A, partial [Vibrio parahaemolyticus 10296]